ncbi:MAG: ATP-dependent 6-phosphofructokinase [Planctomycetota bacterium]|jgi:6-phosphofructokinase 1|nr:ATP-dependent 6-phosphofructokinase [Planctomycetota bacterium]
MSVITHPDSQSLPDFTIKRLGPCKLESPLTEDKLASTSFLQDDEKTLYEVSLNKIRAYVANLDNLPSMELAGPRANIFFDPSKSRAAVVTCGGLCPGLNNVIRGLTLGLHYLYGVKKVYGFQYGYEGFIAKHKHDVLQLTPELVDGIHEMGGTILASSRGEQSPEDVVDCLDRMDINLLFTIGGDGTMRGAMDIAREIQKRELNIAVIGIPKTIDNDIAYTDMSFGFQTAYAEAVKAIRSAHTEAKGAPNGIGLVRLMGRHSGFIACSATLAQPDVNYVLIPEAPFELEGPNGFFTILRKRLLARGHAVVVVAEGAGQDILTSTGNTNVINKTDASGNIKLKDIGTFLRDSITTWFRGKDMPVNVKYIDPSYLIRSVAASPIDSVFCGQLARNAVHAALTGRTEMLVGFWKNQFVHVPIHTAISSRKTVDPSSELWRSVLETTGQPNFQNS